MSAEAAIMASQIWQIQQHVCVEERFIARHGLPVGQIGSPLGVCHQEAVTQWCDRAVRLIPERPVQVI